MIKKGKVDSKIIAKYNKEKSSKNNLPVQEQQHQQDIHKLVSQFSTNKYKQVDFFFFLSRNKPIYLLTTDRSHNMFVPS